MSFFVWSWVVFLIGCAYWFYLGKLDSSEVQPNDDPSLGSSSSWGLLVSLILFFLLSVGSRKLFPERTDGSSAVFLQYMCGWAVSKVLFYDRKMKLSITRVGIIILILIFQYYFSLQ